VTSLSQVPFDYSPDRLPWYQRRTFHRWLLGVALALVAVTFLFLARVGIEVARVRREVAETDARFARVQRGMSVAQVQAVMGRGGMPTPSTYAYPAWDDERLSEDEGKRIASALRWDVKNAMLLVFEVTFDRDGKVVGKHRYD